MSAAHHLASDEKRQIVSESIVTQSVDRDNQPCGAFGLPFSLAARVMGTSLSLPWEPARMAPGHVAVGPLNKVYGLQSQPVILQKKKQKKKKRTITSDQKRLGLR